ncbi:MAG: sigma 54-interacting transcriptional regulator [Polyangiaceae bacterium]
MSEHDPSRKAGGAHDETVQADPAADQASLSLLGSGIAVDFPLPRSGKFVIGRGERADIRIDHASVSREHALVEVADDGCFLTDLGSKNGTRVRGTPLEARERVPLPPGVLAELGEIALLLRSGRRLVRKPTPAPDATSPLFGESMRPVLALIDRVADDDIPVLLLGPTGAGKEVLAERLHHRSRRAAEPFLRVHCAAITPSMFESELFGHEKGSFTGASATKPGLLETADGGTVFIDEVGEVPAEIQTKLLRVLEDRRVQRVGGLKPKQLDVRFVAATNRDLAQEVAAGRFRQDLYYRLSGVSVKIPSLATRRDEILPLARLFAERASRERKRDVPGISGDAEKALREHDWPGNVRELRHVMARAVLLSDGEIRPEHLGLEAGPVNDAPPPQAESTDDGERARILRALEESAGNQTEAAKRLGMSRRNLLYKLDRLGIARPRKR